MTKDKKGKDKESTALAVTLANDKALGQIFVDSGFFSDAKEQSQAIVKILAGREVGLQPIEAMTGIHIVKGKVTLGANLMAAAVKKSEDHNYKVTDHTEERCVIEFYENDELIGTSEFTIEDAKKAGVVKSGGSWMMYPRNMLFARAMSNGVKWYCPDVFGHAPVYVPEEMGAEVDGDGEPINVTPIKQPEVVEPEGALTYDQLGDLYNEHNTGRKAKTLPMEKVTEWASKHPELFRVDDDGYYYLIEEKAEVKDAEFKDVKKYQCEDCETYYDTQQEVDDCREAHEETDKHVPDGVEPPEESEYECTCPDACLVHEDGQEPEEDEEPSVTVSLPDDLIDDSMKPRDALDTIMEYAMEKGISNVVRPVIVKHYKKYDDGSRYPYHIPESKVIKIVEELTSIKTKKAEKVLTCLRKDCKSKITEGEAEEQEGLCLECYMKEND